MAAVPLPDAARDDIEAVVAGLGTSADAAATLVNAAIERCNALTGAALRRPSSQTRASLSAEIRNGLPAVYSTVELWRYSHMRHVRCKRHTWCAVVFDSNSLP